MWVAAEIEPATTGSKGSHVRLAYVFILFIYICVCVCYRFLMFFSFDRYPLPKADGSGFYHYIGSENKIYTVALKLPDRLTCTQCVLQVSGEHLLL